jgi:hypothetical protein
MVDRFPSDRRPQDAPSKGDRTTWRSPWKTAPQRLDRSRILDKRILDKRILDNKNLGLWRYG